MAQASTDLQMLNREGRPVLAYRKHEGGTPTLVFLPGYASDMEGAKAQAVHAFAIARGFSILRFDYSGTGSSEGAFEDGTLTGWLDESLEMIERQTSGPLILLGSSMGGWLALLIALRLPERVRGIVGIAAAPDFTDWGFGPAERAQIEISGTLDEPPDGRIFTHAFWQSGQQLLLLQGEIDCGCPVRLVHGEADADVPIEVATRLMGRLRSADVQLTIVKGGGHRLSEPHEIRTILRALDDLLESSC
ncbi:MAG: alpha/beta fold hydrolase [Sphingomicrobium sp.]